MEIEALPPMTVSLTMPFVFLVVSIFFIALGLKLIGDSKRVQKVFGFIASFGGIAIFAASLIPIVSAFASTQDMVNYKTYLYENYDLRLEENSSLAVALTNSTEESVISVGQEVIATECEGKEVVGSYDLWVTRKGDTIYLFEQDSKPFKPCTFKKSIITRIVQHD